MNRREFLGSGSIAGAGLLGRGIAGGSAVVLGGALMGAASSAKAAGYWTESQNLNNLKMASEFSMREYAKEFPELKTSRDFLSGSEVSKFSEMQRSKSNDWIKRVFSFAESALAEVPPSFDRSPEREGAFLMLDYPFIVDNMSKNTPQSAKDAWFSAMKEVYGGRSERLVKLLEGPSPEEGVDVFKFYNAGIILKSAGECVAIDLRSQFAIPFTPKEIKAIVKKVDVLFITHFHGDHTDTPLIEAFLKAGKNVFAPDPTAISRELAEAYPNNFISVYKEDGESVVQVGGALVRAFGARHLIWSKRENACPNNVYLVEMGGLKFVHTGDNGDVEVYKKIGKDHKVDVLFPAIWAKMISAITHTGAERVVTIHEQELGHQPHARVEYRWIYDQIEDMKTGGGEYDESAVPWVRSQIDEFRSVWKKDFPKFAVLARGEKIHILPQ